MPVGQRRRDIRTWGLLLAGWIAFSLFAFRRVLLRDGVVANGDLGWPLDAWANAHYFAHAWNPWLQSFSVHPPKLVLVAPFTALTLLGLDHATATKLYLPTLMALAGASATWALSTMLRDRPAYARWGGALAGGLAYAANPWVLDRLTSPYWLVLGYAVWPILIVLYWEALEGRGVTVPRLAALAGLLALQAVDLRLVFMAGILMATTGLLHLALTRPRRVDRFLRVTVAVVLTFLGFSAFWLLPFLRAASTGVAPGYVVTEDVVALLSRNQRASSVLLGHGEFTPSVLYAPPVGPPEAALALGLAAAAVALLALVYRRRDRLVRALVAVLVLGIALSRGSRSSVPELYHALVFSTPVGWLFRDPSKLGALVVLPLALLLGFAVAELAQRARRSAESRRARLAGATPPVLVAGLVLLASWPVTTGDLNGALAAAEPPADYAALAEWFAERPYRRPLFLQYTPLAHEWNPTVDSAKDLIGISLRSSVFPRSALTFPFLDYAFLREYPDALRGSLAAYLGAAGVTDVVVRRDLVPEVSREEELHALLDAEPGISLVLATSSFSVYAVEGAAPAFRLAHRTVLLHGSHEDYARLLGAGVVDPVADAIFLGETLPRAGAPRAHVSIVRSAPLVDMLPLAEGAIVVKPFDASRRHQPSVAWSKEGTWNPLHGEWRASEVRWGVRSNQTDLGLGLVVADAPGLTLRLPVRAEAGAAHEAYLRAFTHPGGGVVRIENGDVRWRVDLASPHVGFVTFPLGAWTPEATSSAFTLVNEDGLNGVNALTLVPRAHAEAILDGLRGDLAGDATLAHAPPEAWRRVEGAWEAALVSPVVDARRVSVRYASTVPVLLAVGNATVEGPASAKPRWLVLDVSAPSDAPIVIRFDGDEPPRVALVGDPLPPAPPDATMVPWTRSSFTSYLLDVPPAGPRDVLVTTEHHDPMWRLGDARPEPVLGFQNGYVELPRDGGALRFRYEAQSWMLAGGLVSVLTLALVVLAEVRRRRWAA